MTGLFDKTLVVDCLNKRSRLSFGLERVFVSSDPSTARSGCPLVRHCLLSDLYILKALPRHTKR